MTMEYSYRWRKFPRVLFDRHAAISALVHLGGYALELRRGLTIDVGQLFLRARFVHRYQ